MKLVLASTFLFSATLAAGVINEMLQERFVLRKRLKTALHVGLRQKRREDDLLNKPFAERIIRPFLAWISRLTSRLLRTKSREKLEQALLYAGNPGNLRAQEFLAIQYGLMLLLALGGWLLAFAGEKSIFRQLIYAGVGCTVGGLAGRCYLTIRTQKRQLSIQKELPEVLDLLTVSIEAGLGFDAALLRVVEKSRGVLPQELRKTLQEMQMGIARRQALRNLGERTGVEDLQAFVSAMIQADHLGVPVSRVIRVQAEQVRRKRRQRVEEKAMKAPIKMLIPLVFFIFPSIFIVLLGPAVMRLWETFSGGI